MTIKTISYSSLCDWQYCTHYYKLCHVQGLKSYENTIWTSYGGLIHKYVQSVLQNEIEPSRASERFEKVWNRYCSMFKEQLKGQVKENVDPASFSVSAKQILLTIKNKFKKEFGDNYEILFIEKRLQLPSGEKWPQEFKGFIDIGVKKENGDIIIIDLKTCNSAYMFNKFKDKFKDYQLTLYKNFYCTSCNVDPKKVQTYFVLLERNEKSKKPIAFVKISSGPRKIKNALVWLNKALNAINKNIWIKNRSNCHKYGEEYKCQFYKTEHCK